MKIKAFLRTLLVIFAIALFMLLVFYGTRVVFGVVFAGVFVFFVIRILLTKVSISMKILFISLYTCVLVIQLTLSEGVIFVGDITGAVFYVKKLISTCTMFVPGFIEYMFRISMYQRKRFPSADDITSVSFNRLALAKRAATDFTQELSKTKQSLTAGNLYSIGKDIPKHSQIRYINKNTLSEEYFIECEKSLKDPHLYIVISNTGSAASEIISAFTKQPFNHASLSFDRELRTIISYNGGENVFPPGLNQEQIAFFNKKTDASIIIYSIDVSIEKKAQAIAKIKEINSTGSAYNLIGLVTKSSFRPNIMFCSQFVYNMLKLAEIDYFDSEPTHVKPTDLVQKDYYRKLSYCYQIQFKE